MNKFSQSFRVSRERISKDSSSGLTLKKKGIVVKLEKCVSTRTST